MVFSGEFYKKKFDRLLVLCLGKWILKIFEFFQYNSSILLANLFPLKISSHKSKIMCKNVKGLIVLIFLIFPLLSVFSCGYTVRSIPFPELGKESEVNVNIKDTFSYHKGGFLVYGTRTVILQKTFAKQAVLPLRCLAGLTMPGCLGFYLHSGADAIEYGRVKKNSQDIYLSYASPFPLKSQRITTKMKNGLIDGLEKKITCTISTGSTTIINISPIIYLAGTPEETLFILATSATIDYGSKNPSKLTWHGGKNWGIGRYHRGEKEYIIYIYYHNGPYTLEQWSKNKWAKISLTTDEAIEETIFLILALLQNESNQLVSPLPNRIIERTCIKVDRRCVVKTFPAEREKISIPKGIEVTF